MIYALFFLALAIMVVPFILILRINANVEREPIYKIYSDELILEFKEFQAKLKFDKKAIINDITCNIDENDNNYMFVNGKRMRLTIDNYITYIYKN